MNEKNGLTELENLFLALADQTRLRLLNLIRDDEICVGRLANVLGESQPKISRHLSYLRNAGLVAARRQGKQMYYKLKFSVNTPAAGILKDVLNRFDELENMREEYQKLLDIDNSSKNSFQSAYQDDMNVSVNTYINNNRRRELETFLL